MKKTLCALLIGTAAVASTLSDKLGEIDSYLQSKGFQVQQSQNRYFTDKSYNFPLLIEESDSNINAGLKDMFIAIDTLYNQGKNDSVKSNFGTYIVVGLNTEADSVYRAVKHEPPTRVIPKNSFTGKKCIHNSDRMYNLKGQIMSSKYVRKNYFKLYYKTH